MKSTIRFQDKNLTRYDFYEEVWVECSSCSKRAVAAVNFEAKVARLFCVHCGFNKESTTALIPNGAIIMAANWYFDAKLWFVAPFKNNVFWAYNDKHLEYLERYIGATLREHKDRAHFTLLEKLPKFYHEAKNRKGLLKVIAKLKCK